MYSQKFLMRPPTFEPVRDTTNASQTPLLNENSIWWK